MEKKHTEQSMEFEKNQKSDLSSDHPKEDESGIKYRGWKVMPFIVGNEILEKLGIIGALTNLLVYLTTVFNMKSVTAATVINIFSGTTNFGTFLAAFLCDTYFGRYTTLGFAIVSCFLGSVVVQLTAAVKNLHPPKCEVGSVCKSATGGQLAFLGLGLVFLIIGAGGIRPCNLPFGADQFNPNTESGKKGIDSFFNWYFFVYTLAQMISLTLIVYIQSNVSWSIGLAIPAVMMFLGCIVYFSGSKLYVKVKAEGSPMKSIAQVIAVTVKKRVLETPKMPQLTLFNYIPPKFMNSKLPYTDQFRFLDKAAILMPEDKVNPDGSPADPWKLCSMQQVEEVKCLLRVMPIWVCGSIYYLAIIQQTTYGIFQALQADRRITTSDFQIPAASFTVFAMLSMTTFIALYDRVIVPTARRIKGKDRGITLLQRVGTGLFISIISLVVSGFVEIHRRKLALTRPTVGMSPRGAVSSMSALWLIPQLMLTGTAQAFTDIGLVEFYYKQFPENMRSISGSLIYCGLGLASYFSGFLISIVHKITIKSPSGNWLPEDLNKGKLEKFNFMIVGISTLNFCCFLVLSKWYKYKDDSNGDDGEDVIQLVKNDSA